MKTFYINQHGCAKNQTDSELIATYLIQKGFTLVQEPEQADYIYINSCGFIQSAKTESLNSIYSLKNNFPNSKIILGGCLAERYPNELFNSVKELQGVFGNGDLSKISDFITELESTRSVKTFEQKGISYCKRKFAFNYKATAYVKITEGCSNYCSFCAIPLIRGELRSRKISDIVTEIKELIQNGVYEINLIGQDLASFGMGKDDNHSDFYLETELSPLACLLKEISKINGTFIVRPLYIHPDHFCFDILDVIKNDKRFVPYFDIPFQSGDDNIIKAMNRKGSTKDYVYCINTIRQNLPTAVIRTTFLTGFPGESKKAFNNTHNFLQNIKPFWSGCFSYSKEEGTKAYKLKKQVSCKVANKRASILQETQSTITNESLKQFIGTEQDVLIEEVFYSKEDSNEETEGLAIGRAWFEAPDVDGCIVVRYDRDDKSIVEKIKEGNVVRVKILSINGIDLDSSFIELKKEFIQKNINFINL